MAEKKIILKKIRYYYVSPMDAEKIPIKTNDVYDFAEVNWGQGVVLEQIILREHIAITRTPKKTIQYTKLSLTLKDKEVVEWRKKKLFIV